MTMCIPAREGVSTGEAEESGDPRYPIEVVIGGHTLRTTRIMGRIFVKSARLNAASAGAPLTVLSHSGGVELLHLTGSTPIAVRDVFEGRDIPLWGWPVQPDN